VDYSFALGPESEAARIVAGTHPEHRLPDTLAFHPAWQPVRGLLRALERAKADASPLDLVDGVSLEFDLDGSARSPVPSVFCRLSPGAFKGGGAPAARGRIVGAAAAALHALEVEDAARHEAALARAVALLPERGALANLGIMLARDSSSLRLAVLCGDPAACGAYLERLGWEGPADEVVETATSLEPFCDAVILGVDLGQRIGARLGLATWMPRRAQPGWDARWAALFDSFVRRGLCSPEEAAALLRWPGVSTYSVDRGEESPTSAREGRGAHRRLLRLLGHTKLVYSPGVPLAAKAYWGIMPAPATGERV
jgi:hypothetical protein